MSVLSQTERFPFGESLPLGGVLDGLPFDADGLLPAIARQHATGEVLMLAWVSRAATEKALQTGRVCCWPGSRGAAGARANPRARCSKQLRQMGFDCDGDTMALLVDQAGPACHTGSRNCFHNEVPGRSSTRACYTASDTRSTRAP